MDISGSTLSVHDVPEGLVLHCGRRPWITELVEQAKLRPEAQQDDGGNASPPREQRVQTPLPRWTYGCSR